MQQEYLFEKAQLQHAKSVHTLYQSLIGSPGCSWSEEYPELEDVTDDILKGNLYILSRSGQIVAAIAAGEGGDIQGEVAWRHAPQRVCELARLGVAREEQGRGAAKLIFSLALERMRERGFDGARLMVSHGSHAARAIYQKQGFECCGDLEIYGHCFICMEKLL